MTDGEAGEAKNGSEEPEAEAEKETDPLIGTVIADRYRVDERLGVGGMGAVYRAEHVLMRKPVAVKVLHREMTTMKEVVKRFELEAIAAGRIDHPNVTVATDFGKLADGSFYLVLEYVPGKSLTELIKSEAPLSVERVLFLVRQVASGLGAAHAAGIVHRDLKPDNIMLIERGGTKDFVKVLDFGIAKVNSAESGGGAGPLTRVGAIFGTPAYMAPEQAAGQRVDHRADIYSLGLVMYEMLAGRPAFQSAEIIGLLTKQLTEPPPPLPESIDAEVRALVMKLLEKDPALRLGTSAELVAVIDQLLGVSAMMPDSTTLGIPSSPRASASSQPDSVAEPGTAHAPTMAAGAVTSPISERLEPARRAMALVTARISSLASRAVGGDSIRVLGRDVPLWLAGASAGAVIMGTVLTLSLANPSPPGTPSVVHRMAEAVAPTRDMGPVILHASEGDRAALTELEAIAAGERTAAECMGIAKGHAKLGEYRAALTAFRRAVHLDASLAKDKPMLRAVRHAMEDEETQKFALELASGPLGESGADVLYDVSTSKSTPKNDAPALARSMLERDEVRGHTSKALSIALELKKTSRCDEAKKLMPRAIADADERSVRSLTALTSRRGCGFLSLSDCFSCLRKGDDLANALSAAKGRESPKF